MGAKAGYTWTEEFCLKDSDGDGQSNGLELGDPSCVWTVGATPQRSTDISHPGYKDSMTTAQSAANSTSSNSTSSKSPGNSSTSSFLSTTAEPSTPNSSTTGPSSGNSTTHSSGNSSTSGFLSTTAEPSNPMSAATSKHAKLMLVFTSLAMPLYMYSL